MRSRRSRTAPRASTASLRSPVPGARASNACLRPRRTPGGAPVGFTRSFLDDLDRERQQLVTELPPAGQAPLERDLLDLRADFLDRAAQVEASGMALRRRTALYDALDGYVAGVTRDPGQIDRAAGRMDSLIAGLGLPEERQGAMRLFVKDALGNAAVDGLMRDPARAERVLSDGLYDDVLSASSKTLRLKEAQDKVARNVHLDCERTIASWWHRRTTARRRNKRSCRPNEGSSLSAADAAYLIETNARATEAARAPRRPHPARGDGDRTPRPVEPGRPRGGQRLLGQRVRGLRLGGREGAAGERTPLRRADGRAATGARKQIPRRAAVERPNGGRAGSGCDYATGGAEPGLGAGNPAG